MMSFRHLAVVVVMLGSTATAGAQSAPSRIPAPSDLGRILAPAHTRATREARTILGEDSMHRLSRKPNVTGGIIGFVVGAAAGATVGCLANKDDYGVFCGGQNDTKVVIGAVVGGAVGAAVGALLFRRE